MDEMIEGTEMGPALILSAKGQVRRGWAVAAEIWDSGVRRSEDDCRAASSMALPVVRKRCCALGLVEQLDDRFHRNKQPPWLVRERSKPEMPIEARGLFINRINDHCRGRNLGRLSIGPLECIDQEELTRALPSVVSIHRQSP